MQYYYYYYYIIIIIIYCVPHALDACRWPSSPVLWPLQSGTLLANQLKAASYCISCTAGKQMLKVQASVIRQ